MTIVLIDSIDDPRVESYRNLKLKNLQRGGQFFIAEGKKVVERLLESDFQTASVFISQRRVEEWQAKVPDHVTLFVAPQEVMNQLVGFDFHVGVVGCGIRRSSPSLEQVLFGGPREDPVRCSAAFQSRDVANVDLHEASNPICNPSSDAGENPLTLTLSPQGRGEGTGIAHRANDNPTCNPSSDAGGNPLALALSPQGLGEGIGIAHRANDVPICIPSSDAAVPAVPGLTVVACPNCDNPENLGAIVRIGAAFGIDALLLGTGCCDPYARRVIRVSMGTAFKLPIIESRDLARDLSRLKHEWQFELAATVLEDDAERLESARRAPRFCLLMGNEDTGLDKSWTRLCDRRLTIPMCRDTDSLNVAVAAGIVLHHFTRQQTP